MENNVALTLSDLTITGGAFDSGAGIYTYAGNVDLLGVTVSGNQAVSAGGGVYVHSGRLSITDSSISDNVVQVFSNSGALADAFGGGVYTYAGEVKISNSILTGNRAIAETCGTTPANALGGAVYTHTAPVTISDSVISSNTVEVTACSPAVMTNAAGAGMFTFGGRVSIAGGDIVDGSATGALGEIGTLAVEVVSTEESNAPALPVMPTLAATQIPTEAPAITINTDADFALRWMEAIQAGVRVQRMSPPVAARVYAYAGVTLYEAVVQGLEEKESLAGRLNGLPTLPQSDLAQAYDWPLVANSALAVVGAALFTDEATLAAFDTLKVKLSSNAGKQCRSTPSIVRANTAWQWGQPFWNGQRWTITRPRAVSTTRYQQVIRLSGHRWKDKHR